MYCRICSWILRSCGSFGETTISAYCSTSSRLGANIRAATKSSAVRVNRRVITPPVRDLKIVYGLINTYAIWSVLLIQFSVFAPQFHWVKATLASAQAGEGFPDKIRAAGTERLLFL